MYVNTRQENNEGLGVESAGESMWVADAITLPIGILDYGSMVSAIIDAKYSNDQMQAIVNNKLLGDGEHDKEFDAMQDYRRYAKDIAKQIVKELNKESEVSNG